MIILCLLCISPLKEGNQLEVIPVPSASEPSLPEINKLLEGSPFLLQPEANTEESTIPEFMRYNPERVVTPKEEPETTENTTTPNETVQSQPTSAPTNSETATLYNKHTEEDTYVLAQMLAGECYDFNVEDQRNAAITVCNRVDDQTGNFPYNTVTDIIKHTGFYGWASWRVPSENNLRVAQEVMEDWELRSAGYEITRPWAPWLYFHGNGTFSNVYST